MNPRSMCTVTDLHFIDSPDFIVRPEHVDYNGHLNFGHYTVLFEHALECLRKELGIGPEALAAVGMDWFAREAHVSYQRELLQGDPFRFACCMVAFDDHRVHFGFSMIHSNKGWCAATFEILAVSLAAGNPGGWPPNAIRALQQMLSRRGKCAPMVRIGLAIAVRDAHPPGIFSCSGVETSSKLPADIARYIRTLDFSGVRIPPDYTDDNGDIKLGFYPFLFTLAVRRFFFEAIGLGQPFMELTGQTNFVAQSHLIQIRKLRRGDPVAYSFKVLALGDKVFHCMCAVHHGREGWMAAVQEQMDVCVDITTRRAVKFHPHTRHRLELALAQSGHEPDPVPRGRAVAIDH